jgi:hypothetical protein
MKAHPKTGRTIREEAEWTAARLGEMFTSREDMIEAAIRRYAAPRYTKNGNGYVAAKESDQRVLDFIKWFYDAYRDMRGATYAVNGGRDGALVKRLLKSASFAELQDCALILLDARTDDKFIQESDRGITILSVKFNWLNQRRAAFLAKQARAR